MIKKYTGKLSSIQRWYLVLNTHPDYCYVVSLIEGSLAYIVILLLCSHSSSCPEESCGSSKFVPANESGENIKLILGSQSLGECAAYHR